MKKYLLAFSILTAIIATRSFRAQATNNKIIASTPAAPTVAGQSIISGSHATLAATAPGGDYQWYDAATGGNLIYVGADFTTPSLTITTTYYIQTTINNATSARTAVTVTVTVSPPPPPAISYAANITLPLGVATTPVVPANTGGAVPATIYGQVSTFAGNSNHTLINGDSTNASFNNPVRLGLDVNRNVFVADRDNGAIREITPAGVVATYATGFSQPNGVTVDENGNVFVANAGSNNIIKITGAGSTVYAGNGTQVPSNGYGNEAGFYYPYSVVADNSGNIYVADTYDNMIRKITPADTVSTLAGNVNGGYADGTGDTASFALPTCVNKDAAGNIYVADANNERIRKITPAGVVTTVAGSGGVGINNGSVATATFDTPAGVAVDAAGNIYVADFNNSVIRKITPAGVVSTFAGNGSFGYHDGLGSAVSFAHPNDIQVDPTGFLYVADYGNNVIRKIITTGYTISGTLPAGLSFNSATGAITGTPTALTDTASYTVTAYNAYGSSSTTFTLSVVNFPEITYGIADFDPRPGQGITYSSSNPAVATIVNNKVHVVGAGVFTLSGTVNGISGSQGIVVNKADLTIIANNQSRYYNVANPALTVNYLGLVNGDTPASLSTQPAVSTTAVPASLPGNYPITVSGAAAANYNIFYVAGSLTVNPLPSVIYGVADFDPKPGEGITYSSNNPAVATIVNNKVHIVGVGTFTLTGTVNGVSGSQGIVVNKADLTITANNQSRDYNVANPALTVNYLGLVNGDTPASLSTQSTVSTTAVPASLPGNYPITVSGATAANYNIFYIDGGLTVNPLPSVTYGVADFDPRPGEGIIYSSNNPAVATIVNNKVHIVGAGVFTLSGTAGTKSGRQYVEVNKAPLVVTANNQTKTAGSPNPTLTISYSGFVYEDTPNSLTAEAVVNTTATTSSPAGNYPITVSGASSPNYVFTYQNGTLEVDTIATHNLISIDALNTSPLFAGNITSGPKVNAALTPNGDGINDFLTINNIKNYPDNKLMIINSSGTKVFEASNYDNVNKVFDGHSNITGVLQARGTYFYELEFKDNGVLKSKTGFIILKY
jgi:gliding motility-associated-like protein